MFCLQMCKISDNINDIIGFVLSVIILAIFLCLGMGRKN